MQRPAGCDPPAARWTATRAPPTWSAAYIRMTIDDIDVVILLSADVEPGLAIPRPSKPTQPFGDHEMTSGPDGRAEAGDGLPSDGFDSIPFPFRVVWAGTAPARDLARALGGGFASQAEHNLAASCVKARATLVVTRAITPSNLCSMAAPYEFTPSQTRLIVAAVAGGPHSLLAARVAQRLSEQLGVPAYAVCGYGPASLRREAEDVLAGITARIPDLEVRAIRVPRPAAIVERLPASALVVVGAPGGNWLERRFLGPGARIHSRAPGGVIVVKEAPARVFQVMRPAPAFSPDMSASDAAFLAGNRSVIVADGERLLGVAPVQALAEAPKEAALRELAEHPVFLMATDLTERIAEIASRCGSGPIPVVDASGHLVGAVEASDTSRRWM